MYALQFLVFVGFSQDNIGGVMFEPIECNTTAMDTAMNVRTLFYGRVGSNTVWGFEPANGVRGVAITDGKNGQVVVSMNSLKTLLEQLASAA